jgi:hypothetical protein
VTVTVAASSFYLGRHFPVPSGFVASDYPLQGVSQSTVIAFFWITHCKAFPQSSVVELLRNIRCKRVTASLFDEVVNSPTRGEEIVETWEGRLQVNLTKALMHARLSVRK